MVNKIKGIRVVNCINIIMVKLIREYNNVNILVLGVRIVGDVLVLDIVDEFLFVFFEGGRY